MLNLQIIHIYMYYHFIFSKYNTYFNIYFNKQFKLFKEIFSHKKIDYCINISK